MYKMLIIYSSSNSVSWSYTPGKTWPCHPTGFLRHHSPRLDSVPFEKLPAWHSASRKTKRLVVLKRSANKEWAFLNYSNDIFLEFQISSYFWFLYHWFKGFCMQILVVEICWNCVGLDFLEEMLYQFGEMFLHTHRLRWHYSLHAFWSSTTCCPRRPISSLGLITHDSSLLSSTSSWAFWRPSFWRQKS